MKWDERQLAMLREMGIRLWPMPVDVQRDTPSDVAAVASALMPPTKGNAGQTLGDGDGVSAVESDNAVVATRPSPIDADSTPVAAEARAGEPVEAPAAKPLVAAMSMNELAEAVAACTSCALCDSRGNAVFGVGNINAHWMIIGEAPGPDEDEQEEPFVGKAGQLLDNMLHACGLSRSDGPPEKQVFITNTLKCRPPGNRNPTPQELAACEPFLLRQIALVQPRIVLAMGRFAVQSLLRSTEPVGKLRGRVHRLAGVPLVVTYHPAYLLRNPEDKSRAWDDLCLAMEVVREAG